jgi:hypothetical protein
MFDTMYDLCPRRLSPLRLYFVAIGKLREEQIDSKIDGARYPKSNNLSKYRTPEFNESWRIVFIDAAPELIYPDESHFAEEQRIAGGRPYIRSR